MSKQETSIVFTGDIGFDKYMANKWTDEKLLDEEILKFFHSADHVVANVEGALLDAKDDGSRGPFFHAMNPEAVTLLDKIHSDIWVIGNNHIMDAGKEGLENSKKIAKEKGCKTIGAGINESDAAQPVYLNEAGGIGIFGVAYQAECIPATDEKPGVFRWDNMQRIESVIKEIKKSCRWCIVVSHGGEEFAAMPNPYTRERYLKYIEMGADIVVAHHPHVPENYEIVAEDKAIFYSLGNFIFDTNYQRAHAYTDTGVLLKLMLTEEKLAFEAIGTQIVRGEERLYAAKLPDIFTNIDAKEYNLLSAHGSKAFVAEEMRKMIYLEPKRFTNASEKTWNDYFFSTEPDGYAKDAHMDLSIVVPFSKTAKEENWKASSLEAVKSYIEKLF